MASDYVKSLIRTYVPVLVAVIATALARAGLSLPASTKTLLASVIGGAVGALWYGLVRYLERRWPNLGWLLGVPGQPVYPPPAEDVAAAKDVIAKLAASAKAATDLKNTLTAAKTVTKVAAKKAPAAKKVPAKKK